MDPRDQRDHLEIEELKVPLELMVTLDLKEHQEKMDQ